jgi:hypothetical protein
LRLRPVGAEDLAFTLEPDGKASEKADLFVAASASSRRQLDRFVDAVYRVMHRHLNNGMPLLYAEPGHFCGFRCRIRPLQLPIYQEAKSAGFRPLALSKKLRRRLWHHGSNG